MANNILRKFQPAAKMIDEMIFKLETNLGKNHTVSPLTGLYQKYSFSTNNAQPRIEEVKKEEQKVEEVKETKQQQQQPEQKGEQKQQQPKQPKPQQPKKGAQPKQEEVKLEEVWEVFSKCDLRVGKIISCEVLPESEHLYKEMIDLGEGEPRLIGSGLRGKIPIEEMLEGYVLVFANLKPRKLGPIMSNGMVMCACDDAHTVAELIRPPAGSKIGERIQLQGNPILGQLLSNDKQAELQPKKKYSERLMEKLVTNENLEATYNGVQLVTSAGVLTCKSFKNHHIS